MRFVALVPDLDSLQRTICIELGDQRLVEAKLDGDNWKLVLITEAQHDPVAWVEFEGLNIPLKCLSLEDLLKRFKNRPKR